MIEIISLKKSFGDKLVLDGVNLSCEEGSITVILGGSGTGKSVLMKHIIGLIKPDEGQTIVDGKEITAMSDSEINKFRKHFGMVFQFAALFDSMTVYENVSFPLREHTKMKEREIRQRVSETLQLVGLSGEEDAYPAELSGGMKKRVGVARAVIMRPKILLWDEPTTGLDPIATDAVDEMILNMKSALGVTSVVISHDIASSFKVADKIAVLNEGKIAAFGSPSEIMGSNRPYVKKFLSYWFEKSGDV